MSLTRKLMGVVAALGATFAAPAAFAGQLDQNDAFYGFWETVDGWTSGALGVGLATTMLLMGGAIGVAKNSPMPALTGIGGAAFLHWGPNIIQSIMVGGGLV
ncbi:hypothetical protein D3C71_22730 [compost metagenome]